MQTVELRYVILPFSRQRPRKRAWKTCCARWTSRSKGRTGCSATRQTNGCRRTRRPPRNCSKSSPRNRRPPYPVPLHSAPQRVTRHNDERSRSWRMNDVMSFDCLIGFMTSEERLSVYLGDFSCAICQKHLFTISCIQLKCVRVRPCLSFLRVCVQSCMCLSSEEQVG